MKTIVIILMLCFLALSEVAGQDVVLTGNTVTELQNELIMYDGSRFPSVKPYLFGEMFGLGNSTGLKSGQADIEDVFFPMLKTGSKFRLYSRFEPVFEASADLNSGKTFMSHSALGISILSTYNKIFFSASMRVGTIHQMKLTERYTETRSVLPGLGMVVSGAGPSYYYALPDLRLHYALSPIISAETGFSTHFFGDGKRSLLLSDEHYPYPYFKITTDIWKLRYVNLFAWHRDVQSTRAELWGGGVSKFTAMHYLSWNVSKRLNISLFEAVVAPLHDSLMKRQFVEYNYLLPVVMYRPLDFALGSNDNVLVGLNVSLKLMKKHVLYGQLLFDELFMNEVRADVFNFLKPGSQEKHGAWVNKQAFQFGWKYYDIFGLEHLDGLVETNFIRPYTYSHRDVQQNYTHLNQALAHPYGANLIEFLTGILYAGEKWFARADVSFTRTGFDSTGTHFGQDIFKPTFDAPILGLNNIPVQYYGNITGQGIHCKIWYTSAAVSRLLLKQYNIWGEAGFSFRNEIYTEKQIRAAYLHFSIRYGIGNLRKGN
jgi:hypothetical protein